MKVIRTDILDFNQVSVDNRVYLVKRGGDK